MRLKQHLGPVLTIKPSTRRLDFDEGQQHGSLDADSARGVANIALGQALARSDKVHVPSPIEWTKKNPAEARLKFRSM
jgi:hypothetical protein